MKRIIKQGLLLAAFIMGMLVGAKAQSTYVHLVITMHDGTEETYDMLNTSYMYFDNGEKLVITETIDGMTMVAYPLADIRKITCQELEGTEENTDLDIAVFPNPTHDKVTFRNVRGKQTVKIYALDGRLMKSFQVTDSQTVDISMLPQGLYLVNVNYKTLKMMKL